MKLQKEFTLDYPRSEVWAFFHDVPAVADCLPGAEYLGEAEDGSLNGKMSMKVGPFQAAFEGTAKVAYDEAAYSVFMEGKGVDKKGASRGKMKMDCHLVEEGTGTKVSVDADIQLSGSIAQFGRTGIIEEIASVLISDFVANVDTKLTPASAAGTAESSDGSARAPASAAQTKAPLSGGRLLWLAFKGWIRSFFQKDRS